MRRALTTLLALALACVLGAACNAETTGGGGSETNWLGSCTKSDQCAQGQCLCGVCTEACSELGGCNDGTLLCASNQSQAYDKLCAGEPEAPEGLCLTPCDGTSCPAGNHCEEDACVPDVPPPPRQRCSGSDGTDPSPCVFANGEATCSADGFCAVASCLQGFGDCNQVPNDGCETNVASGDANHCGTCLFDCETDRDWAHVAGFGCANSQCTIEMCAEGWGDCDADRFNGCETELSENQDHCDDCPEGFKACDGECVSMDLPQYGCADPSPLCLQCQLAHGEAACGADGLCAVAACHENYGDCDGDPANGCETNVANGDEQYCGNCLTNCEEDEGWPRVAGFGCANSQCTIEMCAEGWGDCDDIRFTGCETDLSDNEEHCGECDAPCDAGQQCNDGICEPGSDPGGGGGAGGAGP